MPAAEAVSELAVEHVAELLAAPWFPRIIAKCYLDFIVSEGRVPRLGDYPPPYSYRGHLLFQVLLLSGADGFHDRWLYYFETLAAGRIPDRPIPALRFAAPPQTKDGTLARLRKIVEKLGREHGYGERALNVLIEWTAFGLGVCEARPDLTTITESWLYGTFDVSTLLTFEYDYFGHLLEEARGQSKRFQGFFLTHDRVCELMCLLATDEYDGDLRLARIHEPAVGSARQLLQASNYSLSLTGADVDPVCVAVTLINAALHAPWLAYPCPAHVLQSTHTTMPTFTSAKVAEPARNVTETEEEVLAVETPRGARPPHDRQASLFEF